MTIRGVLTVAAVEASKQLSQTTTPFVFAACAAGPFIFAAAIRLQSAAPEDTLFGRSVRESGFAVPLVVLGFAALWLLPVLASLVGGDAFASEDRYGTWKTLLTRSRRRSEVFAGKVLTSLAFSSIAVVVLAASSVTAGIAIVGRQPIIDLSGALMPPPRALAGVVLAWASVVPPTCAFTAIAVLASLATRSSAAGIGLPVAAAATMQMAAFVDGPEIVRRLLLTPAFAAWHGLLIEPPSYRPLALAVLVSGVYSIVCLAIAYRILQRRDICG